MARFFFNLEGGQNTEDPGGFAFETEIDAFRAAERFATELGSRRPTLRGNTCVVVTRNDRREVYYVGV